jgi:hypothetical protein
VMNTSAQLGGFASSLAYGYLVESSADYNLPFIPMALLLLAGAGFWLKIDPTRQLVDAARSASLKGI